MITYFITVYYRFHDFLKLNQEIMRMKEAEIVLGVQELNGGVIHEIVWTGCGLVLRLKSTTSSDEREWPNSVTPLEAIKAMLHPAIGNKQLEEIMPWLEARFWEVSLAGPKALNFGRGLVVDPDEMDHPSGCRVADVRNFEHIVHHRV